MKFYRNIRKQARPENLVAAIRDNKVRAAVIAGGIALLFYILLNSNGIYQRIKLELQKQDILEKIDTAKEEQKLLKEQSKALDGDSKAIEKVAREKYGMVREKEKVYKVAPKK